MFVRVSIVLKRTVGDSDWHFDNLSGSHLQIQLKCTNQLLLLLQPITWQFYWPNRSITRVIITIHWRYNITLTLKMTTSQVVETSVTVTNSSFQNYTHLDDHTRQTTDTLRFKPFTFQTWFKIHTKECRPLILWESIPKIHTFKLLFFVSDFCNILENRQTCLSWIYF